MSVSILGAYTDVLADRRRQAFVCAGLLARLYRSMTSLGTVLLVAQSSGSYAVAGSVAGASVVGVGLSSPVWSRYVDRYGEAAVLRVNLVATVVTLGALVAVVTAGAPSWTWLVAGFAVGACALDFGALVRSRWAGLLGDAAQRHTAIALESVLDELSFVIGPALVSILAAVLGAPWALLAALLMVLAGGSGLLALRDGVPAVRLPAGATKRRRAGALLPAGVLSLTTVYVGVGLLFTSVDVSSVAAADERGTPALAGLIVACFAGGSVVSGLLFGPLSSGWGVVRRLLVACSAFAVAVQLLLVVGSTGLLPVVGFAVGLTTSPVLISAMASIERRAERHRLTEAMSWPSVMLAVGVTGGSVVTGVLIDDGGALHGFVTASAGGLIVGLTALVTALATAVAARRGSCGKFPGHPSQQL